MKAGKNAVLGKKQNDYKKGGECAKCHKTYATLTVEHIIPVSILTDLGLAELVYDDADNMEPLCYGCNRLKAGHLDPLHPKTHELLARYVRLSEAKYENVIRQSLSIRCDPRTNPAAT